MNGNTELKSRERELFNKVSVEDRKYILDSFLDIYFDAIKNKVAVFPVLSTLSIAMLIIATLSKELIPIPEIILKIIISIFLLLIPLSLLIYILDEENAAKKSLKLAGKYSSAFEGFYKNNIDSKWDRVKERITNSKSWNTIASEFPIAASLIYLGVVIYLLWIMWN